MTAGAAATCCVPFLSPLLVTVLGASTAVWVTGLRPWAPYLLGAALLLLAYALWSFRRSRACRPADGDGPAGLRGFLDRITPILLGLAVVVWLTSAVAVALSF